MKDRAFGLRALGVALTASFSLVALMAVAAQAETLTDGGKAGLFLVNRTGPLATIGVTFSAAQVGSETLSVPGRKLGVLCAVGTLSGEFKSDTEALGSTSFSQCSAWENVAEGATHTKKLPCTVTEPIKVSKMKILPKKHEGSPYLQFQEDGETFTKVELTGAECTLPKVNEIKGTVSEKIVNNDTVEPTSEASEAIQKLMGSKLLFGTFEAQLRGGWKHHLTGAAHVGLTLGVS